MLQVVNPLNYLNHTISEKLTPNVLPELPDKLTVLLGMPLLFLLPSLIESVNKLENNQFLNYLLKLLFLVTPDSLKNVKEDMFQAPLIMPKIKD